MIGILLLLSTAVLAQEPLRVAIVDTGLDLRDPRFSSHICPNGSEDMTGDGIEDRNGHGTHIAGLIKKYAGDSNYCLLIYNYYGNGHHSEMDRAYSAMRAFQAAINHGAKIINFSGGGESFSGLEYTIIKSYPYVTFVVAAGNGGKDITLKGNEYYPASYGLKNIIAVGNMDVSGHPVKTSNYAPWLVWEQGMNMESTAIRSGTTLMSGTSMSTAIRTGKLIKQTLDNNR